jgi:hypothetical protein
MPLVRTGQARRAVVSSLSRRRHQPTYGEGLVHWVKVRVDPRSSGVFSIEQKIVKSNPSGLSLGSPPSHSNLMACS